jgi:hypothetical protein
MQSTNAAEEHFSELIDSFTQQQRDNQKLKQEIELQKFQQADKR